MSKRPLSARSEATVRQAARRRAGPFEGLDSRLLKHALVSIGLLMALGFTFTYQVASERSRQASRAALEALADAVENNIASALGAQDAPRLQSALNGLLRHASLGAAELQGADGGVLASARRPSASELTLLPVQRTLRIPAGETAGAADPGGVYTLVLRPDDAALSSAGRVEGLTVAGLAAVQALLAALLGHLAWVRGVSRPIASLARQLRAIGPDSEARLATSPEHRHDDIGMLVDSANALLDTATQALERERRLRADMARIEARYQNIFESSSAGIFVLDTAGKLVASNPTVTRLTGMSTLFAPGASAAGFTEQVFADPRRVQEMMRLARQRRETASGDLELRPHAGSCRWVHCLVSVQDGGDGLVEGVIYDITERKSVEHTAMYHSQHDALTGLKNRAGTLARVQRRARTALADQRPLTLLVIDLDGFKSVNDRHGHHAGDQVLVACAQRMRSVVGRSGPSVVGRLGGDEFMVVLERLGMGDPLLGVVCKALLDALAEPIVLEDGPAILISASIGVASLGRHGRDAQALIEAADKAMYAVKDTGKNNYALAWSGIPVSDPMPEAASWFAGTPMFSDSLPMDSLQDLPAAKALSGHSRRLKHH